MNDGLKISLSQSYFICTLIILHMNEIYEYFN